MRRIIAALLLVFGISHFIAAVLALDTPNNPIGQPYEVALPVISLLAGVALAGAGLALFTRNRWWRPATGTGALLSLMLMAGDSSVFDAYIAVDIAILVGLARVWISDWDNGQAEDRPARTGRYS